MVHVPYKGGPEAIAVGDAPATTCCIMNQVQTVLPQWKAGKVRLLGVTTKNRVGAVSEIPTIAEAGVPGYESYIWFGLFGPKGLDAAGRAQGERGGEGRPRDARGAGTARADSATRRAGRRRSSSARR